MRRIALAAVLAMSIPAVAMAAAPDTIYVNGKIVTVNAGFDIAQAVAVSGEKIVAVGSEADIRKLGGATATVVDLGGKTMLPGFVDNHIHLTPPLQPWKYGGMIGAMPEWVRTADTTPKLLEAIRRQTASKPKGEWIVGTLSREDWPNQTMPTRKDLDTVSPDHPVALGRGPHTLLANTRALEIAKVTRDTKAAGGGEIGHDASGEPNGLFYEAARNLIYKVLPNGDDLAGEGRDPVKQVEGWRIMLGQLESMGVTSANVAAMRPNDVQRIQALYDKHGDTLPRLTLQLRVWPGFELHDDAAVSLRQALSEMDAMADRTKVFTHPKLKMGGVKMNVDGGLSAPIIRNIREYENRPGFYGEYRIPAANTYAVIKRARELNWQVGLHTMGDAATALVVDMIVQAEKEVPGKGDLRNYLHHVSVLPPEDTMQKMARYKIAVASQPGFLLGLGSYADEAQWPEQEATQEPAGSMIRRGVRVSFGSDGSPYGPIPGLYAAVTRKVWDGTVRGPGEAVSIKDAIIMHTIGSAYFTFDEKNRGSIEPGKFADLIVLSDDPLTIDPEAIKDLKVERTIVGGKQVYLRGAETASN